MNQLWKSLRAGIRSDYNGFQWAIGKWESYSPPVKKGEAFIASERIVDAKNYLPMEVLPRVEVDGVIIKSADKWTCEKMRILEAWEWPKEESVDLAIFAAELALPHFEEAFPDDARPRKAVEAAKCCRVAGLAGNVKDVVRSAEDVTLSVVYAVWWNMADAANAARSAEYAALSVIYATRSAAGTDLNMKDIAWSAVDAAWSAIYAARCAADAAGSIEDYIQSRIPYLECLGRNKGG
jgi:hypothetical protein